ncbi:proto-oncogene tyrosine-protein kinase Met [Mytilus galloprovincialis]|nr:proto-oncogene tyrosine-protein kinase Met [Mytilus galloprovincialis]
MYIRLALIHFVSGILTTNAFYQKYTVPRKYDPLSKIIINEERRSLYIGGNNTLLHFDLDLRLKKQDSIGPVNDSKQCNPFDNSCIYMRYQTVNNHISILKSFRNSLIVCGTALQGICYMYNAADINIKNPFVEDKKNYLGSKNSSVLLVTKDEDGTEMFFIGQSFDGRKSDFFSNMFATFDISKSNENWNFDHYAVNTYLSVCETKREQFKIKFLHVFEASDFIFHVFIRSINDSGTISYETRISKLCKESMTYSSYEEMPISCKTPTKYDIGIAAHYDAGRQKLYMTFGVSAYNVHNIQADNTQGSVICVFQIDEIKGKFDREVLSKCFANTPTGRTPSWHCQSATCASASDYEEHKTGALISSCSQRKMEFGTEAHGEGFSKTAIYQITSELLTSVLPFGNRSADIILAGSNTGFLRKILATQNKAYVKFDVSGDRNVPVASEMVLDTYSNLYLLTGNKITKLSMTSCEIHQTCGQCVISHDPLGCGWCFDHCSTRTKCQYNMWHTQSCPPFVQGINPENGPLEGSTTLTITGENFGSNKNTASVSIGHEPCLIKTINDTSITCLTSRVRVHVSAAVKVRVTHSTSKFYRINGVSEQRGILFDHTQSSIQNIFPMKGPISGNTTLTITGDKFEIGSNLSVKVGKMNCDIQTKNDTEILCRTQSCGSCPHVYDGGHSELSLCRYSGNVLVAIDGAAYQLLENKTFCYMPNPEIIQPLSRNSIMISGGLNIEIHGKWFDSVTNHGIMISVGDAHFSSSCRMKYSGSLLICSTPNLSPELNKSTEVIVGRMAVMLDNNTVTSTTFMIYPDPEIDYLDIDTQLKDIEMNDKLLELKGQYLNSAARKEDYIITINGSRCPVIDLHQTYLICNLSNIVHIKDVPLPVEVSVGLNWKSNLGYLKFCHVELHRNQLHVQLAAICLGTFSVMILCLICVMRKKHLGVFRKKKTEEFSVAYLNNTETGGLMDPPYDTGNSSAEQGTPIHVNQQGQSVTDMIVAGASFDAIGTADMLKQQNIFIERDLVRLGEDIGHGNFGCVYKGYLLSLEEKEERLVAVKTVLKTEVQDINAILNEALIMKDFEHPNVLSLIGISVAPGEFPLVIIPFVTNGDLLSYIRSDDNKPTVKDLVKFGLDIARGMEYLGSIKFVHRDLAARNCMVDEDLKVKVADFGLARDIYTKNYYSSDNKKMLPVKWMAPESLENGTYGTQSDVWSFGVVMWELITRGSAPYCDVNNWDMHKYLQSGRRLKRTDFCPPPLYDIMMKCWEFDPDNRPTFREINQIITGLVEQHSSVYFNLIIRIEMEYSTNFDKQKMMHYVNDDIQIAKILIPRRSNPKKLKRPNKLSNMILDRLFENEVTVSHTDSDVVTSAFIKDEIRIYNYTRAKADNTQAASKGEIVTSCTQRIMEFGIEARGDGFSNTFIYHIDNELLTSILPWRKSSADIILAGSNTGFLRKILVTSTKGKSYVKFDVSGDRNIPVANEMVLDTHSNLYLLSGNRVTKLSMTSCQLHTTCGECVTSHDPLGCGWCFGHCSTDTNCQHNIWHTDSCPPFVLGINPASGPLEGSTKVTIAGQNFGSMINNATVSFGAASCLIQNINDTRITCLTSRVVVPVSTAVKVSGTDSTSKTYRIHGTSEQVDILFEYTQSSIMSIFPMKGPISGSTMLTISGDQFEIGSNLSVKIGKVLCDIQSKNNTEIVCLTQSCGRCVQAFEGEILEMTHCKYSGDIVVAIDGASYQPLENKTFCYMPNPEIIQQPSRNSTIISGGLNIEFFGNWFDSVTNHGIMISVGDVRIGSSCTMKHSGSLLVCSTPDLKSELNKSSEVIEGRMSVMLDNNPVKPTKLMIYPDPELDYLDIDTQLKDIEMKDKLLQLKGRYLNSAARKEDYKIKINGSSCPVIDLHQSYLICNLSNTVHIKDVPLLVEVSVGHNWKTVLGNMRFFHVEYRKNQIHVQLAAICLGTFAVLILCLVFVMRKKHLGVFRKKATEEFSVVYLNSTETRGLMDPPTDTGNSSTEQGMPRYVKQNKKESVSELVVEGATWDPKPGFDAIEIVDMLKQQNIFIERDLVRLGQDIGHGNFGCVYQGYLRSMEERDEQLVAVKTVLKTEVQDINAILDEAMIMKDFNHANVLSLIGISVAPGEFPLVIIPFMSNGDLLSYIRSADNKPTIKDLVKFGLDVAKGMEYLGSIKFVHRDLAARNCMMDENLRVKVADFGLARDIYTKNYYSSDNKKMLPVKWMAPESLENGTYSTKSDVWSFGVVMWELMTRGSAPYCDVNNWDMHKYLQSGRRLKRTDFCPPPL